MRKGTADEKATALLGAGVLATAAMTVGAGTVAFAEEAVVTPAAEGQDGYSLPEEKGDARDVVEGADAAADQAYSDYKDASQNYQDAGTDYVQAYDNADDAQDAADNATQVANDTYNQDVAASNEQVQQDNQDLADAQQAVNDAQQVADDAQDDKDAADDVLADAQDNKDATGAALNDATENKTAADGTLAEEQGKKEATEQALSDAQDSKDAADQDLADKQDDYDSKVQDLKDARKADNQAGKALEEAQSNKDAADQALAGAQAAKDAADQDVADKQDDFNVKDQAWRAAKQADNQAGEALEQARADGYEAAVFVTISAGLSATNQTVRLVGSQMSDFPVIAVNTRSIGVAAGMVVIAATEMVEAGIPFGQLEGALDSLSRQTRVWFSTKTLSYLRHGGRISEPVYRLGTILNIKPVITCDKEGYYVVAKKTRGWEKSLDAEVKLAVGVAEQFERVRLAISCSIGNDHFAELEAKLRAELDRRGIEVVDVVYAGVSPDLLVHTGPDMVGVGVQPAWR